MSSRGVPKIGTYTIVDTVSFVRMKIETNEIWARRALEVLFQQQTPRERKIHLSRGRNNWGFNKVDSPKLSSAACKQRKNMLTRENVKAIQPLLQKYARQIVCLAYEKDKGKKLLAHLDLYYQDQKSRLPF